MGHPLLAPVTLNFQWRIIVFTCTWGPPFTKWQIGEGKPKENVTKLHKARPQGKNYTAMTKLYMPR